MSSSSTANNNALLKGNNNLVHDSADQRSTHVGKIGGRGTVTDSQLISSLTARLNRAEATAAQYKRQAAIQERTVSKMSGEIEALRRKLRQTPSQSDVHALRMNCFRLSRQVHEMETFLSDYGMIWVGSEDSAAEEAEAAGAQKQDQNSAQDKSQALLTNTKPQSPAPATPA